jgi:hypothetical protein
MSSFVASLAQIAIAAFLAIVITQLWISLHESGDYSWSNMQVHVKRLFWDVVKAFQSLAS